MSVYVDESNYKFGRMIMCHMVADSINELHEMADKIGILRRYFQCPPLTKYSHYDICKAKRAAAVKLGAKEITSRELVKICQAQVSTHY